MTKTQQKHQVRILVIDDTKTDRDLFKYFLTQAGYDVELASNGHEAMEMLAKKEFDLALCDYQMPVMNGYDFLVKVKGNSNLSHMVVIIITSDEAPETQVLLLKAGANDFIHKGSTSSEILARIKTHLDAQAGYFNRQILSMAGRLASELNQPLGVIVSALDVLKEKISSEIPKTKQEEFVKILQSLNNQADQMTKITEDIRKLGMDTSKVYKIDKKF